MDASGCTHAFAPRITCCYTQLEPVLAKWSPYCTQLAVFEHEADTNVSSTHCHILMLGCKVAAEQFKRIFRKVLPGLPAKGNEFWKWESKYGTPDDNFLTYMSKGNLRPKFVKNFPDALVEERRQQWKITTPKDVESSKKADMYDDMVTQYFAQHDEYEIAEATFDSVRRWVFHWCYKRTNKVPHATQYKQYAGSLYLKIGEKTRKFSDHADEVFSLWY